MKAFVAVSCLLAVVSANNWAAVAQIGPHGVPIEPAANIAARAAHAAAHASAGSHGGNYAAAPTVAYNAAPAYGLDATAQGIPHDTPEVAAAKASHFAALAAAGGNAGIYGTSVATPNAHAPTLGHGHGNLPQDTPEVAAAKAAHFAALAAAGENAGHGSYGAADATPFAAALGHGHGALPQDTPEVAAAKSAHFAALAAAGGNAGHGSYGAADATPYAYAQILGHGQGALPHDTPEVDAAKAAHLAAHTAVNQDGHTAAQGAYDDGSYRNGGW